MVKFFQVLGLNSKVSEFRCDYSSTELSCGIIV